MRTLVLLFAITAVVSCAKKDEGKAPAGGAPKAAPTAQAKPGPAVVQKQMSSVTVANRAIDFTLKRDPFKPLVATKAAGPAPAAAPIKATGSGIPILSYDVTQFKLIGIVAGLKENRAMVVDPAGKGYVLKEGMKIGKNEGKITRITAAYIEVQEVHRGEGGKPKPRMTRLTLPRKQ